LNSANFAPNHKKQNLGVLEFLKEKKNRNGKRNSEIYKEITPEHFF
jgi:hypothetical protein